MATLRRIFATVLAAGLPFVAVCRVACAAGMPIAPSVEAAPAAAACHHAKAPASGDHRPPCCMTDDGGASVLLQSPVSLGDPRTISVALPPLVTAAAPSITVQFEGWSRPPPLIVVTSLAPSRLGSRAPPSPASIL